MKRNLLFTLLALVAFAISTEAQKVVQSNKSGHYVTTKKKFFTGAEAPASEAQLNNQRFPGLGIGITYYDLQSNGSCMRRVVESPSGELGATWTMSLDEFDASFPNRGSGFNTTTNGEWGDFPTDRLEDRRVGWPSINYLPDGSAIIINHTADGALPNGPFNFLKQNQDGTWSQDVVISQAAPGMLWPRSVVSDDGSIHVIGITTPVANDGAIYEGLDGHLLYFRSTDGGTSWDKFDEKLPGIDQTNYNRFGGDAYAIDANGSTIAIAHFADWNDITVYKSTDNGDNWTRIIVNDFPLDNPTIDQPYTLSDIGGVDTLGPGGAVDADSAQLKAIYTSDNSGSVVVDNDGKVHVFYGIMYVSDVDYTDGNSSFFPGWNGLAYWNEDMPAGERPAEITGALDLDGNGQLDLDDIATYFYSLSSMPYAAVAPNNELFLAYSAITEEYVSTDGQNYRHIYMMKSVDGGENWEGPFDVINEDLFEDDDLLFQFVEATFPSITVDENNVHLVYQQD